MESDLEFSRIGNEIAIRADTRAGREWLAEKRLPSRIPLETFAAVQTAALAAKLTVEIHMGTKLQALKSFDDARRAVKALTGTRIETGTTVRW